MRKRIIRKVASSNTKNELKKIHYQKAGNSSSNSDAEQNFHRGGLDAEEAHDARKNGD